MIKRNDFVERSIYLLREKLEENLPLEATLDEMVEIARELIKEIF